MDISSLDLNKRYTVSDYLSWHLDEMVELIRGRIYRMTPAPSAKHQRISVRLSSKIYNFLEGTKCEIIEAPFDVYLPISSQAGSPDTVVQPDICVICDPDKVDEKGCQGAPDLIIEIVSPGNSKKEMKEKYEIYEESGVREYWIINPLEEYILIFHLSTLDQRFIGGKPFVGDSLLNTKILDGINLTAESVFDI